MNILSEAYSKAFAENEKNIRFWENYLQNLGSLNFSQFDGKLKVPTLVPIGSRILFRGELKHTNELTIALGADYFVKCSVKQAEVLRQHRIKDAQSKLDTFIKEKVYLENQMSFTKQNVFEKEGQEIIEYHTEEEDKAWREKHRENMRQYKQRIVKEGEPNEEINDELWNRLDELELQEELENELLTMDDIVVVQSKEESFQEDDTKIEKEKSNAIRKVNEIHKDDETSKLNLLQQVIDRQKTLENKLSELKDRDRSQSMTEQDLLLKLDEMEELDELEDEMDRLDDIIENEDVEEEEEGTVKLQAPKIQRRVSFVDEDDSKTLILTFKHTPTEPNKDSYDPEKGILKPSDIYQAYSNLFESEKTSILKKSKYQGKDVVYNINKENKIANLQHNISKSDEDINHEEIIVNDIVEKVHQNESNIQSKARPTSLFKQRRMQPKS